MAKKNSGGGGCLIVIVIFFSLMSAAYDWASKNVAIVAVIAILIIAIFAFMAYKRKKEHEEWVKYLYNKYKNNEIVDDIVNGRFWQGQNSDQLKDSLGSPAIIDRQVLKTKTKEVWKYRQIRKGQFALKIYLDNDKVIGWDQKD